MGVTTVASDFNRPILTPPLNHARFSNMLGGTCLIDFHPVFRRHHTEKHPK